jgi:hypothetical protein
MKRAPNSISSLAIAGFVAFAFGVAPVGLDYDFTPEIKSAFAKGKGSGNSGGKGGSKSSKGGASNLDTAGGDEGVDDKIGNGHIKAKGNGHAKNHDGEADTHDGEGDASEHGKLSSSLGNLNAAHASPTALEHASPNSMVGLLAAYAAAVAAAEPPVTPEEEQAALGAISNKTDGEPVD